MKSSQPTRGITPERAQKILLERGVNVSLDKATLLLKFMYEMAELELTNFFKDK